MTDVVDPHVRYCHGCGAYDDHPRARVIVDDRDPAQDKLFHYDCLPEHVVAPEHEQTVEALTPILEARASGARGEELRAFVAEYAPTIPEAPADPGQGV